MSSVQSNLTGLARGVESRLASRKSFFNIYFSLCQQAAMPIQQLSHRKLYRQQYYQNNKGRYITSYQKKREGTFLCDTCHTVVKLVSKSAHQKTRKHVYAYYTAGCHPTARAGGAQSAEREVESPLREEQGEDEDEGSSKEGRPGAVRGDEGTQQAVQQETIPGDEERGLCM
jgi:hypothetical protein